MKRDWRAWHDDYDDPQSPLARRLRVVQARVAALLDAAPPGPLCVISMCAGQGRDVIGVLNTHPRGCDVTARLVELDPRNATAASQMVTEAGLRAVSVVVGDAGVTDWTRGRSAPDRVPRICQWFRERDFELVWVSSPDLPFGVGVHRFTGHPQPLAHGARMFAFVDETSGTDQESGTASRPGPVPAPGSGGTAGP